VETKNVAAVPDPPDGSPKPEEKQGVAGGAGEDELVYLDPQGMIERRLDDLGDGLDALVKEMVEVKKAQAEARDSIKTLADDHKALILANEQMGRLGELHYNEHVIEPMVRELLPAFDMALTFRAAHSDKDSSVTSAFRAIQSSLQSFLATYSIEHFLVPAGAKFDPATMKAVRIVPTDKEQMHSHVQGCLQAGFKGGRRVLRPSSVVLWRYEKPHQPQ
jgi:molecular chaperone GrpE (heat shock protein)